ncbi:stage V sporulation protein AC [Romboutsia sp. CE17]|uniref:stage V sporulation protein AB n=1 Tax=Romboutsia sp. CE17 TaxID=2724150 RepID=UPI001442A678|nr:stage V sporulation protein AB [Romboutsia sp. CE17]QJA09476.1 stage V sporulation protein AC [Romboutsia sp. CE17]
MRLFLIIYGISSGVIVGAGVVSVLILIGIVPRMSHVTNTKEFVDLYEDLLVIGTFLGSILSLHNFGISGGSVLTIVAGLAYGVFLGFLSSGLTEVLYYIPVVSRRLKIPNIYLKYIVISLIIGKVVGSLLGWVII